MFNRTLFLITLLFPFVLFAGPGEAGGGGTIVKFPNPSVGGQLLDLYIFQKQDPKTILSSGPGQILPETENFLNFHLAQLTNRNFPIIQMALKKLTIGGVYPKSLIRALHNALIQAPIFYTDYRIAHLDKNLWIPDELKTKELMASLTPIAYYAKGWGIFVSKSDFEKLDQLNQIALLIHEALRHVQIFYELQISNQTLEILTSSLTLGKKSLPENILHELQSIFDVDNSRTPNKDKISFVKVQKDACEIVKGLQKKISKVFDDYVYDLCWTQTIDYQTSNREMKRRSDLLSFAIEGSIYHAIDLENGLKIESRQRKFWSQKISELMSLGTDLHLAILDFGLHSEELNTAMLILEGTTRNLEHFSINAALKGNSPDLITPLRLLMEKFVNEGLLLPQ